MAAAWLTLPHPAGPPGRENRSPTAPGTLRKSASKKDLHKQQKLTKRVSDLEGKLSAARRELGAALGAADATDIPPVPALPRSVSDLPSTGRSTHSESASYEASVGPSHASYSARTRFTKSTLPSLPSERLLQADGPAAHPPPVESVEVEVMESVEFQFGAVADERRTPAEDRVDTVGNAKPRVAKRRLRKRKAADQGDDEYQPATESERDSEHELAAHGKRAKKQKRSQKHGALARDDVVVLIPNGDTVPPMPSLPREKGTGAAVSDDGYGGLGHEMF